MLRTKEEYRKKISAMKPNVSIGGQMVSRDDPRLIPGVNVIDLTYDIAQDPRLERSRNGAVIDYRKLLGK